MAIDLLLLLGLLHISSSFAAETTLRVQFTLITDTIPECDAGLTNGGVYAVLEYRLASVESPAMFQAPAVSQWQRLSVVTMPAVESDDLCGNSTFDFPLTLKETADQRSLIQFRVVQWEHGGGLCNCWGVLHDSWRVSVQGSSAPQVLSCGMTGSVGPPPDCSDDDTSVLGFCSGSASVPRGFITHFLNLAEMSAVPCWGLNAVIEPQEGPPLLLQNCSSSTPRMVISFHLKFTDGSGCDPPEGKEEGVELAVGNWENDGYWIPLVYYYRGSQNTRTRQAIILFNDSTSVRLRGYNVLVKNGGDTLEFNETLSICNPAYFLRDGFQFRWLQTTQFNPDRDPPLDAWTLDNVDISIEPQTSLVRDDFDSSLVLNADYWNQNLRNGNLTGHADLGCATSEAGNFLYFYDTSIGIDKIASRLVRTAPLEVGLEGVMTTAPPPITTSHDDVTPDSVTSTEVTTDSVTSTEALTQSRGTTTVERVPGPGEVTRRERLNHAIELLRNAIANSPLLLELMEEPRSPDRLLELLASLPREEFQRDSASLAVAFLLGGILREVERAPPPPRSDDIDQFSRNFLSVADNIVSNNTDQVQVDSDEQRLDGAILGSSILSIVEDFSLTVFSADTGNLLGENIRVSTARYSLDQDGDAPLTFEPRPEYSVRVPRQLGDMFRNLSANENGEARMVSHLFQNMEGVIPGDRDTQAGTELASSIVSTALQCGNVTCETNEVELTEPVVITIRHSSDVEQRMLQDNQRKTTCVFWEFLDRFEGLSIGQWSDRNCSKNESLSNSSVTVCECTHLTHFAILLSASPPSTSPAVTLSLQVIGYVGVSVSLVAMGLTIIAFLLLKPLRNMRNFIHINLCISLGIAQIIFVAAVDMTSGSDDDVPAHCQAVAVLLHYFFLVAFMWMLMEGVVLYVALVKVFVKRKKLYMLGFAVSSYGLPLLYMGLTLPLGFALDGPNYGYASACFLNPSTGFIWAFIAPVIVIILINCGFFVMAVTIIWRHQKKKSDSKLSTFKNWLKSAMTLVVIMGLTWIFGVLIVEVEQLLPLAYIYTILVAFQGLFIFVIFVPFSKQVREAYSKWWRAKVNESDILSKYFGDNSTFSVNTKSTSSNARPRSMDRKNGLSAISLTKSDLEDSTAIELPVIPITPSTTLSDDNHTPYTAFSSPTSTPRTGRKSKHWGTVKQKMREGSLFQVTYSPSYFKHNPATEETADTGNSAA